MYLKKIYDKFLYYVQIIVKNAVIDAQSKMPSSPVLEALEELNANKKEITKTLSQDDCDKRDVDEKIKKSFLAIKNQRVNLDKMLFLSKEIPERGNIYLVKMSPRDMKTNINGTNHACRPFVVLDKTKEQQLVGFYTTSNLTRNTSKMVFSQNCFTKYRAVLAQKKYKLNKSSLVLHDRMGVLEQDQILKYFDSIDDVDLIRILKMANLSNGNMIELKGKYLSYGDIASQGRNRYLIYSRDNSFAYGLKVQYEEKIGQSRIDVSHDFNYFASDSDIYRIFFDQYINISNSSDVILEEHVADKVLKAIDSKRNRRRQSIKKSKVLK